MPTAALEPTAPKHGHAEEALISAIREARKLSADLGLGWVQWFDKALIADPEVPYHPDILPPRWPRAAQRCAARAMQAWVFGGSGSWNDYQPDSDVQERFENVTRQLHSATLNGLLAVTNCDL